MALYCTANCPTVTPPAPYWYCNKRQHRKAGGDQFILIRCGQDEFSAASGFDILNLADWQTKIDAGEVNISPCGKLNTPAIEDTTAELTMCGPAEIIESQYTWDYETHEVNSDYLDDDYWCSVKCNFLNWRFIPCNCDGSVWLTPQYADYIRGNAALADLDGIGAGIQFGLTGAKPEVGESKLEKWTAQFTAKLQIGQCYKRAFIPGLKELLAEIVQPAPTP